MAFSTSASARPQQPADLLRQARARVLAAVDDPVPAEPAPVTSLVPLRALPAEVAAIVEQRQRHGLTATGRDFDRQRWLRLAMPAAVLAGPALAAAVIGLLTGHGALAAVAGIVTVLLVVVAVLGSRHAAADPLYLGPRERRAIAAASCWQPTTALPPGRPAAVLAQATAAARRIVATAAWRDGRLVAAGVALPLGAELDRVERAAATDTALERVAVLAAYADVVEQVSDPLEPEDVEALGFLLTSPPDTSDRS